MKKINCCSRVLSYYPSKKQRVLSF